MFGWIKEIYKGFTLSKGEAERRKRAFYAGRKARMGKAHRFENPHTGEYEKLLWYQGWDAVDHRLKKNCNCESLTEVVCLQCTECGKFFDEEDLEDQRGAK